MTSVALKLEEMRDTVGEIDALDALALESFDRADWRGADQFLGQADGYLLGMIARSGQR